MAVLTAPKDPVCRDDTYTNSLGMTFQLIPAGTFIMGSPDSEVGRNSDEGPQHQVTISQPFYMQTTVVTQGQWQAVTGSNPAYFSNCGDRCPVEMVSWDQVQEFITAINKKGEGTYRLPTEAEWEYSARAGTTTAYSFGDDASQLGDYAWFWDNSRQSVDESEEEIDMTHPVATKLPNPWGLYDMHGNVHEWVSDWCSSYTKAAVIDPKGPSHGGSARVIRGGGWYCGSTSVRSADRNCSDPAIRHIYVGVRLLRIVP